MTKYDINEVAFPEVASATQACCLGAYVCTADCTSFVTNIRRNKAFDCKKQLDSLICGD